MNTHMFTTEDIYPRDEEHRYRLYGLKGDDLTILAAAGSPEGIGQAIVTLATEADEPGDIGRIGIMDVLPNDGPVSETGTWIVNPFERHDHV